MPRERRDGFETRAIHAGQPPDAASGAVVTPITLSSTFVQEEVGKHAGYEYARSGNPTRRAYEECLASLEGAVHGFAFAGAAEPHSSSGVLVSTGALIAVAAPDAYLARRQRRLALRYRQIFPDFIDLLVICIDAGLSFEAAFDRVRGEIFKQSRELGANLEMMSTEMRAGRSTLEALEAFTDRLGFDEATSFNTMLRQSLELGSDIGGALRIFGDDMRDKRLLRAEEAANKLSVKMILPLGLFIFPVVLLVVMLPVIIKLLSVLLQ